MKTEKGEAFASPFRFFLDRLRLGKHQLCARFGAERDLARVAVEARGLVSLERDALLADNDVNLARAAVDAGDVRQRGKTWLFPPVVGNKYIF